LKVDGTKPPQKFDDVFKGEGIKVKKVPFASPNLNAFDERYVQSIKHESLDQFVVFGEGHLQYLVREYEQHYNTVRPHQAIGNKPIGIALMSRPDIGHPSPDQIECESQFGGLLRHYHRKNA
jgi:putative transposase